MRNKYKIIHVMVDEKFNDMAIRQFEEAEPGIHEYLIVSSTRAFTKSPLAKKTTVEELMPELTRPDVIGVVFHSMPSRHYRLLRYIPDGKCVAWIGWGFDYYSLLKQEDEESRILSKTRQLQSPPVKRLARCILKPFLQKIRLIKNGGGISDLERVDLFSPVLDIEYEMVCRCVPLRADYIPWNYGTAEDDLSPLGEGGVGRGRNILAGNSATATNNHIELFEAIRDQLDLTGRKVVVPLSYGDNYYRRKVIERGEVLLGDAFLPLIDFMPKLQYQETIQSCGFVMMNHLRQQALGNIFMGMLIGAKIFLNKKNPLTSWLTSRGAVVGAINELDLHCLKEEEREANKAIVYAHMGREQQKCKTKRLISVIFLRGNFKETLHKPPSCSAI